MRKVILALVLAAMTATLSGCVFVRGGGHHHHRDYCDRYDGY
jgi:predicted small secreted protein